MPKKTAQAKVQLKANKFETGAKVQWKWLGSLISGEVKEVYFETVTKTIKGKTIKRLGTKEMPAYLVESSHGNLALKLQSELIMTGKKSGQSSFSLFSGVKYEKD